MEPSSWTGMGTSSYTLASGNLRVGMRSYSAGFVNSIANQILDWMMGGSFPSGHHVNALLRVVDHERLVVGHGAGSGSYARVSLARNSTNFGETGDAIYLVEQNGQHHVPGPYRRLGLNPGRGHLRCVHIGQPDRGGQPQPSTGSTTAIKPRVPAGAQFCHDMPSHPGHCEDCKPPRHAQLRWAELQTCARPANRSESPKSCRDCLHRGEPVLAPNDRGSKSEPRRAS